MAHAYPRITEGASGMMPASKTAICPSQRENRTTTSKPGFLQILEVFNVKDPEWSQRSLSKPRPVDTSPCPLRKNSSSSSCSSSRCVLFHPNDLLRTFDGIGEIENNAATSAVHTHLNATNSVCARRTHGQDERYRCASPPGTFISPSPGPPTSSFIIDRWVMTRGRTFLMDWLAENAYYVLCKHATTTSSAVCAAIHADPASFRRTATLLAVSHAYSADAYTPSL